MHAGVNEPAYRVKLRGVLAVELVAAAGVGPHVREGDLVGGTLLKEQLILGIE